MAITLETIARNAACDATVGLLDGGTLELLTSADAVVATHTLGTPAFGAAANGVATANAIADDTNTAAGTITKFSAKTSGGAAVFTGTATVTGGGGDIELTSDTLAAGETSSITSLTHTQPAT